MHQQRLILVLPLLTVSLYSNVTIGSCEHIPETNTEPSISSNKTHYFSDMYRLYKECFSNNVNTSYEECISTQVVLLVDQVAHQKRIPLMDGLSLVNTNATEDGDAPLNQQTLEASLPRSLDDRQSSLYNLLVNKVIEMFQSHSLQIELSDARRRRGGHKLKKMIVPFLIGAVMKVTAFIPLVLAGMKILALKSFVASKAALAIMMLMGMRKLFSGGHHDVGHEIPHKSHHVHSHPHIPEYMSHHGMSMPVPSLPEYGSGGQDAYSHAAAYGGHPHPHGHSEPYYGRALVGDAPMVTDTENATESTVAPVSGNL